MSARIYQRPKSAMQSGKALTEQWILDFEPSKAKQADPLMGWAGQGDTREQVQLKFGSRDAATDYADRHGIAYRVIPTPKKTLKLQSYADNFR